MPCKRLKIEMARAHGETRESIRNAAAINILPDDIFLEIFAFCLRDPCCHPIERMGVWQRLVHVCQRWRQIICASPHYLDLHICCTNGSPFREDLSHWPAFPIIIVYHLPDSDYRFPEADDDHDVELIAALEHPDRVRRVDLNITNSEAEVVFAVMQVPFPVLTHLELIGYVNVPVLPGGFLGGSAPCLQHLRIEEVSFPDLPTLLLSARGLVSLRLNCGYISPESMVVGLAELTRLRTLSFVAQPPFPPPEQTRRRPDPPMLAVLPALTQFVFAGDSEYLEDLVAQIDTPRVDDVRIQYFMEEEEAQTPHLSQFIGRLANLKLAQFGRAQIIFHDDNVCIELDRPQGGRRQAHLSIPILDGGVDFLVPYVVHDAILSNVGQLSVRRAQVEFGRQDDVDRTEWLPLLHLFPAVETMHVSRSMAGYIASALEDIAEEMVTEVLPALHLLCLEDDDNYDYDSDNIKPVGSTERFLSLRQISGRPVTIVNMRHDFVRKLKAHRTC